MASSNTPELHHSIASRANKVQNLESILNSKFNPTSDPGEGAMTMPVDHVNSNSTRRPNRAPSTLPSAMAAQSFYRTRHEAPPLTDYLRFPLHSQGLRNPQTGQHDSDHRRFHYQPCHLSVHHNRRNQPNNGFAHQENLIGQNDQELVQDEPLDFSLGSKSKMAVADNRSAGSDVNDRTNGRGAVPRSTSKPKSAGILQTAKATPYPGATRQHHRHEERAATDRYDSPPLTSHRTAERMTSRSPRRDGAGRSPSEMDHSSSEDDDRHYDFGPSSHHPGAGSASLPRQIKSDYQDSNRDDYFSAEEMDDGRLSDEEYQRSPTASPYHRPAETTGTPMVNPNQFPLSINPYLMPLGPAGSAYICGGGLPSGNYLANSPNAFHPLGPLNDVAPHPLTEATANVMFAGNIQALNNYFGTPQLPLFTDIDKYSENVHERRHKLQQIHLNRQNMQLPARRDCRPSSLPTEHVKRSSVVPLLMTVPQLQIERNSPASPSVTVGVSDRKSPHENGSSSRSSSPPTNHSRPSTGDSGATTGGRDDETAERTASGASAPIGTSSDSDVNLETAMSDVRIASRDAHHVHQQQRHRRKKSASLENYFSNNEDEALSPDVLNGRGGAPPSHHSAASNDGMMPMRGKKRGQSLPDELKDAAYYERRRKNNEAAKRSRDARRAKEEEIAVRATFLEQENLKLRVEVNSLKSETTKLRCLLYNS